MAKKKATAKKRTSPMLVHEPGDLVTLGRQQVKIIETLIKASDVEYRVVWWNETSRMCEWISSVEITEEPRSEINFISSGEDS
jgi:hypothetical protein